MNAQRSMYPSDRYAGDGSNSTFTLAADPDPHHVLTPFLLGQRDLPVEKAEEAILSWLVLLSDGLDPAQAAVPMIALPCAHPSAGADRLKVLLNQITEHAGDPRRVPRRRRSRPHA